MDTSEACCSQSSSTTKQQSEKPKTNKERWAYVIKKYQAYDNDKYRKIIQDTIIKCLRESGYNIVEPGRFAVKHGRSAPYHLFFTRVDSSKKTYNQQYSITFPEILDKSLGKIVNSLHLTFKVDITWLCMQYALAGQRTNMMILYGDRIDQTELSDNITAIQIRKPSNFGCHHTKIIILQYSDGGIRVVVSTANLFFKDWEDKTQGLWISPHLPPLPKCANLSEGESGTNFKKDLRKYLSKYKNPALHQWIELVKKTNFFDVNVFLVASFPGDYKPNIARWGHRKLSRILFYHATLPEDAPKWPLIAQSSSIGSLGLSYKKSWLSKEMVVSMSMCTQKTTQDSKSPEFKFIYPSLKNYEKSYDYKYKRSSCLSYSMDMHNKQKWIESYLYQWRAKRTGRTRAMPHIKSYMRVSPDLKSISWFVLSSANLSKAAWGVKQENKYSIKNHEVGVVFLPKFITATTTFPIKDEGNSTVPIFPIPYDLPLHQYHESDTPYITREELHNYQQPSVNDPDTMIQNQLLQDAYN